MATKGYFNVHCIWFVLRVLLVTFSFSLIASGAEPAPVKPVDPVHAWVGLKGASSLDNWVRWQIAEERRLIAGMLAVKGPRTVENTLLPYDRAEMHLTLAGDQGGIMFEVHPDKAVRDKAQELVQVIATESTGIALNQEIYHALAAVDISQADAATKHYMERTLLEYRLGGVDKDQITRDTVKKLEDQITEISLKFSRNVQDDVRKIPVKDKSELEGLPEDYIARHTPDASGAITLTTDSPDMTPVMSYAKNAKLRRAMFLAYNDRAYPANEPVLHQLLDTRQKLATTLGFATWADLATADQMMGSATKMRTFLDEVDVASRDRARREFAMLQDFVRSKDPSALPVTLSDAGYWNEQYRRSAYAFDSQSVRPYFPYAQVEAGVLKTASRLFHLEFHAVHDAPVWDPSVRAYDVYDSGQKAGRIYLDMHPREGKDKWFSESGLVPGMKGEQLPETTLVCNFSGGVAGDPGLMQFDEVVTFFHEFGHMMHEVLGGKQHWAGQSGVTTEGDFVEAPSQMLEEMFHDPTILQSFAKDYKTGQAMPLALISQMNRASYFGRGRWVQQQLLYSNYALQVHDRNPDTLNFYTTLKEDYVRFSPYQFVAGDHFYASFTHLTGYSSNYYTYVLDKVIAVDFFAAFDPNNLLDGPAALRYRKAVLEPGSSKPAAQLVQDFLGRPESIDALKHWMDKEFEAPPIAVVGSGSKGRK
ncbi:M3 family metallopeptidase [Granulicella arctica]|uniref:Thimet oligopeptidase n=1 Tax=Granulicella arctica TaxID=940613 RepID=A0A7Y9PKA0_9BACT|nr:M3 family metallopeptidase [Granulicella arctica]NYF80691.1 thimet oligopeptidase [Granulicella arctica]